MSLIGNFAIVCLYKSAHSVVITRHHHALGVLVRVERLAGLAALACSQLHGDGPFPSRYSSLVARAQVLAAPQPVALL